MRKNSSNNDATSKIGGLENRIAQLERRIEDLEQPYRRVVPILQAQNKQRDGRGRKPKIKAWASSRRDELIELLEDYWPEFELLFEKPERIQNIKTYLEKLAAPGRGHHASAAKHLLENLEVLIKFLKTPRYARNPRHVANALAGVPEVSFWRSLKVLGAKPSERWLSDRALPAFIKKKLPDFAAKLAKARDTVEVGLAFRNLRTKDPQIKWLKDKPEEVLKIWKLATPKF